MCLKNFNSQKCLDEYVDRVNNREIDFEWNDGIRINFDGAIIKNREIMIVGDLIAKGSLFLPDTFLFCAIDFLFVKGDFIAENSSIQAREINVLGNIKYYDSCIARESFKCKLVKGIRINSLHRCLDKEIKYYYF
jgi:hypothetical protein